MKDPLLSPSRRTLNNYDIFYAKPSRKTLNKFGKPSITLIIRVLSDFHLLCGFTRDCIVILLSEYFNLNIRRRNPCHSNFITNIRSHTCVPTTNSLQISISRKLFCIYISCSVTSLCS